MYSCCLCYRYLKSRRWADNALVQDYCQRQNKSCIDVERNVVTFDMPNILSLQPRLYPEYGCMDGLFEKTMELDADVCGSTESLLPRESWCYLGRTFFQHQLKLIIKLNACSLQPAAAPLLHLILQHVSGSTFWRKLAQLF